MNLFCSLWFDLSTPRIILLRFPTLGSEQAPSPHRQTVHSLTSNPWPTIPILARYRLVMLGPCACSTFVYVQSLSTTHAFAMDWRFVHVFYHAFLASCGVNYFLILHSLCLASFKGRAFLDCGPFSLLAQCLLPLACQYSYYTILLFLLQCYLIHTRWASFGPTVYSSLNWLQWPNIVIGFILVLLWAFLTHYIAYGLLWPISFSFGILGPLSNFIFSWVFTNFFGLP